MAKDMTQGSIAKALILFSLPLIASGLLQQLYGWVDAFVVGNIVGEGALAAIGVTGSITHFFILAINGFTSGVSILSARYYGQGEHNVQKSVLSTFLIVTGAICFVLSFGVLLFSQGTLKALATPDDIFNQADIYLKIIMLGIPALAIYNVYAAVLRGIGDSSAPFYSIFISSVLNVILDILFVAVYRWGVGGASLATVISQTVMAVFIICYTYIRYPHLRFGGGTPLFNPVVLKAGCTLALPITIQSLVMATGNLVLQNFMNSFGSVTVAAVSTAYRIDSVIMLPILNLGTGIATITSQNVGAGNRRRSRECLFIGIKMMLVIAVCLMIVVLSLSGTLLRLFGITEDAVMIGTNFFRGLAPFYIIFGLNMAMRGYREGLGDVVFSGVNGILTLFVRVILSYALRPLLGNLIIALAEGFAWCFQFMLFTGRCFARRNTDLVSTQKDVFEK